MFVLDTNTLIYFFRGEGQVSRHLLAVAPAEVAVPSVVVYELETGIAQSSEPLKRRSQLDALLSRVQVLPFGLQEAGAAANVRAQLEKLGTPIGPLDTLIAGTALAHRGILVTRNTSEFQRAPGLAVVSWYD
jgi:tRNA(fMet)-specific endonuclease VapC